MFHNFDPYDALMTMNERLCELEKAHNNLAHAFDAAQKEQKVLLHKYHQLEKSHLALADHYFKGEIDRLNKS